MLEDTFEGLEDDDLEDLADKEVEKVLFEVTNGERGEEESSVSTEKQLPNPEMCITTCSYSHRATSNCFQASNNM